MDTSTKNGAAAIPPVSRRKRLALAVFGIFLILSGLALAAGGIELITLGGSWYYLLAGLGLILAGVLYWRRKPLASGIVAALVLATLLWALWEIGFA
ncbi:MAG: membrane-bound PQQ-dependent dehydrogenase, glucose/quinate/shikimate family, partial [Janthinobacterium sp.]